MVTASKEGYTSGSSDTIKLQIEPLKITLKWSGDSHEFDGKTYNPSYEPISFFDGDSCTVQITDAQKLR